MKNTILRMAAPIALAAAFGFAQDSVNLSRTYKAEESSSVLIQVDVEMQGQQIKASAQITSKISKLLDAGKAKANLSAKDLKVDMGGTDLQAELEPIDVTVDSLGLLSTFPTHEAEWMFTLSSLSQIVPGKSLKPGDPFDIAWANESKTATIKGKGKFLEMAEVDGVKAAKIEIEVAFVADSSEAEGKLTTTSWIDPANGRVIKCQGHLVAGDGMDMKFTCKQVK